VALGARRLAVALVEAVVRALPSAPEETSRAGRVERAGRPAMAARQRSVGRWLAGDRQAGPRLAVVNRAPAAKLDKARAEARRRAAPRQPADDPAPVVKPDKARAEAHRQAAPREPAASSSVSNVSSRSARCSTRRR
jgi:hypothetical protein